MRTTVFSNLLFLGCLMFTVPSCSSFTDALRSTQSSPKRTEAIKSDIPPIGDVYVDPVPVAEATIFIASTPPVCDVYMDGVLIGKTNMSKLRVTAGTHAMRFVKDNKEANREMTFKAGDNHSELVVLK